MPEVRPAGSAEPRADARLRPRAPVVYLAAALLASVSIVVGVGSWRTAPVAPPAPEMRLDIATPPTTDPLSFDISPDGKRVAFVATFEGRPRLWLRDLNDVAARPLAGTDFAAHPFWSPDSQSIGFFAQSKLKRLDLDAGRVRSLAAIRVGLGGTWTYDHAILFSAGLTGPIWRVSDSGGEPQPVTPLRPPHTGHRFPRVLPDGEHFLYYATGAAGSGHVYVARLDGSDPHQLLAAESSASYLPSGHLVYVARGIASAVAFDLAQLSIAGKPVVVADRVAQDPALGRAALSVSATGLILYRHASSALTRQLLWFDRKGVPLGALGEPDSAGPAQLSMAPNGREVAVTRVVAGKSSVWRVDTTTARSTRVTSAEGIESYPVWSPDGQLVVLSTPRGDGATPALTAKAANVRDESFGAIEGLTSVVPEDWTADGRFVVFSGVRDLRTSADVWAVPAKQPRTPVALTGTPYEEADAQVSPDGRWIAYHSDESGLVEVYVQPFMRTGPKVMVSAAGGSQVRWKRDGSELFYLALDGRLMAVPIRKASAIDPGAPVPLFRTHTAGDLPGQGNGRPQYVVSPDGQRFLVHAVSSEDTTPIVATINWTPPS